MIKIKFFTHFGSSKNIKITTLKVVLGVICNRLLSKPTDFIQSDAGVYMDTPRSFE
ncbi:MAG: hypothetical protein LBJ32_00165 [Oscillospiraceae bacterium]|nr:hypothetical protein [Oscillospiraceae bacterium]